MPKIPEKKRRFGMEEKQVERDEEAEKLAEEFEIQDDDCDS